MEKEVVILMAEDDDGHALLIQKNLKRAGIVNEIIRFKDGQEVLDFLFQKKEKDTWEAEKTYLLILDIMMPKVDGVEVLRRLKSDDTLKTMPVIMLTTTDDPREVENCHRLGCNNYVTKPIDYDKFVEAVRKLGLFLLIVKVPTIDTHNIKP